MLRVALTGGIGCGKSTVCQLFAEFGVPVVDADLMARQLVEPGRAGLAQLVNAFGTVILDQDGSLNRSTLRKLIFEDAKQRQKVDLIMHPLIYAAIDAEVSMLRASYCLIAVPLLVETGKAASFDRVLVVDCREEIQLQRLIVRDNIDAKFAEAMITSQTGRSQRLAVADDIIDNSNAVAQLAEQVKRLHNSYLLLATTRKSPA